jgi:NADH:ubiquinone oxidoreductase subunit 5 (subunit L)/multisubunit Na+/H+ antiporter MnhA subunit
MLRFDLLLLVIVVGPFAAATLALAAGRLMGRRTGFLMVIVAVGSFLGSLQLLAADGTIAFTREWIPGLCVAFSLRAESFGLFFALLISGIGALVAVYSLAYIPHLAPARLGRYYAALLSFMGAMLGVALADDLVLLFICWEITSISSYLLIGFWSEQEQARAGALTALLVTALGGLTMLIGFLIIGTTAQSFSLRALTEQAGLRAQLLGSPLFPAAVVCVLVGALTKSAQWPFHFWLPGAMVAPTPVSAYLHAATMVKAGIFLLGRFLPIFGTSALWANLLVPIGLTTFLLGGVEAFLDTDLKGMLAKTTLATLGLITLLYGLGAAAQDALQIFAHATYKGALFLVVGIVEHVTHTRDTRELGGLRTKMPVTFVITLLAALSLAGIWPSFGFLAKEALYVQLLAETALPGWLPIWLVLPLAVLANGFLFAVACRLVLTVFLGAPTTHTRHAHEGSISLLFSPAILASLSLGLGLAAPTTSTLVSHFSSAPRAELHLSLLPSHAGPVALTLLTFLLGAGLYRQRAVVQHLRDRIACGLTLQTLWDRGIALVTALAVRFSVRWQSGSLRWYLAGSLVFTVGLSGLALQRAGISVLQVPISLREMTWYGAALCAMLGFTAIVVGRATTRLGAAIALTANGFLTALLFVVYRSPDILLTQILIETVSTIFLLLVLYYLPAFRPDRSPPFRWLVNLAVAAAVGFTMFSFILLSTSPQFHELKNLGAEYLARSLAQAGGANAVNVIIVDFRAIDTNGEITVLVLVSLLVYGVLRARRKPV